MKTVIAFLLLAISITAFADTSVGGYTRRDGTYVAPHMRTDPNGTRNDNYSTRGNQNPYTGTYGTKPRDEDYRSQPNYGTGYGQRPSRSSYGHRP